MDYTSLIKEVNIPELVKALRYTAESISRGQLEVLRANVLSDAAAAIEALQAERDYYKAEADKWQESAESKERLLGMYRSQNMYSANDKDGRLIVNLCADMNRSESPNT